MNQEVKVPPHSKEAEAMIIGIMLLIPNTVNLTIPILKAEEFYAPIHQTVYKAIVKAHLKNGNVDVINTYEQLLSMGEKNIPIYEINQFTVPITGSLGLDGYIRIVKDKAILRNMINITGKYNDLGYSDPESASELLSELVTKVSSLMQDQHSKKLTTWDEAMVETLKNMEEASLIEGSMIGIGTSLKSLDRITLGFAAPDLTILAAGPGEGKSTMMLNAAKAAGKAGKKVCIFSLEMKTYQLMLKVFSSEIDVEVSKLRTGKLSAVEWDRFYEAMHEKLNGWNVHLNDIGGLSILELVSIVKALKAKEGCDIVFVDYLLLLTTSGVPEKFGSREEKVNYISKRLKALAMELNIPVVALTQLSRMKDKRMYQLSDLRESGAIEQDADCVMFVYRPKYNKVENDANGIPYGDDDAFIIIEKNRLGPTGLVPVKFIAEFNRFEEKGETISANGSNWKPVKFDEPSPF